MRTRVLGSGARAGKWPTADPRRVENEHMWKWLTPVAVYSVPENGVNLRHSGKFANRLTGSERKKTQVVFPFSRAHGRHCDRKNFGVESRERIVEVPDAVRTAGDHLCGVVGALPVNRTLKPKEPCMPQFAALEIEGPHVRQRRMRKDDHSWRATIEFPSILEGPQYALEPRLRQEFLFIDLSQGGSEGTGDLTILSDLVEDVIGPGSEGE